MSADQDADAPKLFATFVGHLVDAEERRRESLETRSRALITVSGTLVTLLLAIAAVCYGPPSPAISAKPPTLSGPAVGVTPGPG